MMVLRSKASRFKLVQTCLYTHWTNCNIKPPELAWEKCLCTHWTNCSKKPQELAREKCLCTQSTDCNIKPAECTWKNLLASTQNCEHKPCCLIVQKRLCFCAVGTVYDYRQSGLKIGKLVLWKHMANCKYKTQDLSMNTFVLCWHWVCRMNCKYEHPELNMNTFV